MSLLLVAVVGMAVLEVVNVSAIAPFLAVVSNPAVIHENLFLSYIYDRFPFSSTNSFLIVLGLGVFGLMFLSNTWTAITTWAQLRIVWSLNHRLSTRLLRRYLHRPYTYFLSHNTADLSKNLLSEIQQLTSQMLTPVILAVGKAVVSIGILAVLVVVNPMLALLVGVAVGGGYGTIYWAVRKRLKTLGEDRLEANEERFTIAAEALGGIKDVKVMNLEERFLGRFVGPSARFSRHQATSQAIAAIPRYAVETLAFGTVILIVVYLLAVRSDISAIVPVLGLYAFAGYRLMPALQQVFRGITQLRFYAAPMTRILNDIESEGGISATPRAATDRRISLNRSLDLVNVSYTYPTGKRPAIHGLTLSIPANYTVGIVGPTGSGKTTVADLILGLLRPEKGSILVDGVDINESNLMEWQNAIGYVPQQIFLCDASIAENIAFGVPVDEIDEEAMREAARIAKIDSFITEDLPEGYNTVVGERGVRLSGGQRQRIGIARALYRNPAVLVFDEATSALDTATEDAVMEAIEALQGQKTIIMIAHRVTTLASCDVIFQIENGRLKAQGTYQDLIRGDGQFSLDLVVTS